ncbi:hypothetical protein [uncultured Clostridium sp.]|uniref:hypothetical protein n=1 Tax=uncultured Clostridium sp. TaxID=59620 RepID=UPI00261D17B1|nr:hypothetical protein [uncultured Clostridium sp.]
MDEKEYLKKTIGINLEGQKSDSSYVIDIKNSKEYGRVFSKLDNCDDLQLLDDNQLITEESSSLMYESKSEPYLLNLLAD